MKSVSVVVLVALTMCAFALGVGGAQLLTLAVCSLLVQWFAFLPSYAARTERYYDLAGSLTYVCLLGIAWWLAAELSPRAMLLAGCVLVWATRLGVFLSRRVARAGSDRRFDELKHSGPRFLVAWTLQALWVFLTPLAVWLVMLRPEAGLGALDAVGVGMWGTGFTLEAVADAQKSAFRAVPENEGRFITSGAWAWSRHPNYLGEILLWVGVFVAASSQLRGLEWVAVVSPVFVTLLLVAGSGIPLLEASADARWGEDPDYQRYKARTPVLVPWPSRGPAI